MSPYPARSICTTMAAMMFIAAPVLSPVPALAQDRQVAALSYPDVSDTVFVYVDYVTGLDNELTTVSGPVFRNNVTAWAKFNPLFKVPTVVLGDENDFYGTFLPEITEHVTHDVHRFNRTKISGYTDEVKAWLQTTGRRTVVIGGISIDNCTLHTTLDLLRDGYKVFVITDVSGANSPQAEADALARMRDAGAVTSGWLTVLTDLGRDFASPDYGQGMMQIIRTHWPGSTVGTRNDTTPDGAGFPPPAN